jgi:serine kinase of HPr protein (carbohydrate metabolism regulator)
MGHCGAGKSSTAAALHARGHAVVADDNAALDYREGRVHVQPAFPYLKMFPEISEFLGYDKQDLQPLHDAAVKQGQSVAPQFPQTSIPLRGIYFLSREAEEGFQRLTKAQAIIEVIRNSVPTRWAQPADCFHLQQSAQLTQALPFFRVRTFSTLSELPLLAASIEGHSRQALVGL